MRKKPVDQFYLIEMFQLWNSYKPHSKDRGEIVARFMREKDLSKPYVFGLFNELLDGQELHKVAARKKKITRKSPEELALKEKVIEAVAKVKYMDQKGIKSYGKPTAFAMRQAVNMGLILASELPDRGTMDRWLDEAGLSRSQYSRVLASRSWDIEAPNILWMTDASPANRIYISKSNIVTRPDIDPSDKHLDEILYRDNLRKVHIYIVVDVHSGAWYARAFASDPIGSGSKRTGENSIDFRSTLIDAMLPKYNSINPFEGIPQILYSDKGSAFKPLMPFFDKLEIEYMHHFPNNPKAKGFAEGGISRIKRSIETCMSSYTVRNIDDFNIVLQNHMVHNNQIHGHYDKFLKGCIASPIRRITQKNISDAISRELERVVDAYGCVSVNKKLLGIDMELVGVKVKLLERNNTWIAKDPDGNVYNCDPNGKVMNSVKDFSMYRVDADGNKVPVTDRKNSEKEKRRNRIKEEGKLLARTATTEDILYPESNLRKFPAANFTKDTHSTLAPDEFDGVEQALTYILTETGLTVREIPEQLFTQIKHTLELMAEHEKITSALVYKLVNILNKSISRLEAINEK